MSRHVDDIIRARHDVKEALRVYEAGVHGVVVALVEGGHSVRRVSSEVAMPTSQRDSSGDAAK